MQALIDDFAFVERADRMQLLVEYADRFGEVAVPESIATRPFPKENHVTRCESDAYVWAEDRDDGTLQFYFAVENPQGISARAWAVIMGETLSGETLETVAQADPQAVFEIFGKDISMGKGQGLMGMLDHVQSCARRKLAATRDAG